MTERKRVSDLVVGDLILIDGIAWGFDRFEPGSGDYSGALWVERNGWDALRCCDGHHTVEVWVPST